MQLGKGNFHDDKSACDIQICAILVVGWLQKIQFKENGFRAHTPFRCKSKQRQNRAWSNQNEGKDLLDLKAPPVEMFKLPTCYESKPYSPSSQNSCCTLCKLYTAFVQ
jgi:hypothetical protein